MSGGITQIAMMHDETIYTCAAHDPLDAKAAQIMERIVRDQLAAKQKVIETMLKQQELAGERHVGKHWALGVGYGAHNFAQAESRIKRHSTGARAANHTAESTYTSMARELPPEERRWAIAFRAVYKVNTRYYIKATPKERRRLEEWALKTAELDTAIGRKAAEVVVHRTMSALEGDKPEPEVDWMADWIGGGMAGQFKSHGSVTGRTQSQNTPSRRFNNANDQMDAYRYLYGQNFPKRISGKMADVIIVDEVTEMVRKK
jgi:hypothetical protein